MEKEGSLAKVKAESLGDEHPNTMIHVGSSVAELVVCQHKNYITHKSQEE
jgi:hypothetical protein